ncbi:MAG TPA: hypothetical protein ENK18_12155 [Deltaproteobacteria bacterium]|nr:hypothetical protein [Deltaproteobacteria bacterium]
MDDRARGSGIGIVGLGACLPSRIRGNDWWAGRLPEEPSGDLMSDAVEGAHASGGDAWSIARRWAREPFHGAVHRRVIDDAHASSDLEIAACRQALELARLSPSEISTLLGYSQVTDDAGPGNQGLVARALELPRELLALSVEGGCASFVTHLELACRLGAAGKHTLMFQSSATSRISDPDTFPSTQVGDGAVAQIVGPVADGLGYVDGLHWLRPELRDGLVLGRMDGERRWYEAGPRPSPLVISARDRRLATQMGAVGPEYCREVCAALLQRNGLGPDDVDFFVCAQAGAWFGEAAAVTLGIGAGRWVPAGDHFQRYGHLLAASAPLNLWVAWTTGRLRVGDLVLIYSPGVGFIQAAALVRWSLPAPPAKTAATEVP